MADKKEYERKYQLVQLAALFALVLLILQLALNRPDLIMVKVAVALLLVGVLCPRLLRPVQILWLGLGKVLSRFSSFIILTFVFFAVLTPLALLRSLAKGKGIALDFREESESFFIEREHSKFVKDDLSHQF